MTSIPRELEAAVAPLPYLAGEKRVVSAERLSGGLQNTNYKVVTVDGTAVVVRIPSLDAEEHGQTARIVHASTLAAGLCGVGPEVCAFDQSSGVIVTRFINGHVLSPSDFATASSSSLSGERAALLSNVVAAIKRLHVECRGMEASQASDVLQGYDLGPVRTELRPHVEMLRDLLHRTVGTWDEVVCCHNDLDPSNIIIVSNRAYLVDWEWSGPGDRVCDLATFCDLCNFDDDTERQALSEYYGEETLVASKGLLQARLKLWRLWFVVRGSLWAAVKAASSSNGRKEESEKKKLADKEEKAEEIPPCDYAEYAATGWKTFAERIGTQTVLGAMERVREGLRHVNR